jgi:hypothetical protein
MRPSVRRLVILQRPPDVDLLLYQVVAVATNLLSAHSKRTKRTSAVLASSAAHACSSRPLDFGAPHRLLCWAPGSPWPQACRCSHPPSSPSCQAVCGAIRRICRRSGRAGRSRCSCACAMDNYGHQIWRPLVSDENGDTSPQRLFDAESSARRCSGCRKCGNAKAMSVGLGSLLKQQCASQAYLWCLLYLKKNNECAVIRSGGIVQRRSAAALPPSI